MKRTLFHRFWAIAKLYWFGNEKWGALSLFLTIIAMILVATHINVLINNQKGNVLDALAAKDVNKLWVNIWKMLALYVISMVIWSGYNYLRKKLSLYWRKWLTSHFLDKYFRNRAFYELSQFSRKIDNPDQRISEDINKFADDYLVFFFDILYTCLQVIAFSTVLWDISPTLMVILLIYIGSGTIITTLLFGRKLLKLNFEQQKKEANFRFGLVRIRENAESIAFYRGETQELNQVMNLFNQVFINYNKLIFWQELLLNAFIKFYQYSPYIIPTIIIGPKILSGSLEIGKFAEAQGAFENLFTAMYVIIRRFPELVGFAAGVERLYEFYNFLQQPKRGIKSENIQPTTINTLEDSCLALQNLTLYTPNYQRILLQDVSVKLESGEGILIVGASGCGKSSLLRALAGLWNSGNGTIIRPKLEEILFLPQRPYMVLGTLRKQLVYPLVNDTIIDQEMHKVLQEVNLPYLVERFGGFDVEQDWANVLSLGEQQRIAFARLLICKPKYVILDEATSALDMKNEDNLYHHLLGMQTTFISVGHRPTLFKYHHLILELLEADNWQVRKVGEKSMN
ncbi:MAG: ABC transporter ATP-binding protein/permease [Rhizonema sp. PD37]|nr:ABC transporter ATP-binding protein/permease [Rhizonema sp. PD37]